MNRSLDGPDVAKKTRAAKIGSIALILLGYSLVAGFLLSAYFLYVDIAIEMDGVTNSKICRRSGDALITFRTNVGYTCFLRLGYVVFFLLFVPISVAFWQMAFAVVVASGAAISRLFNSGRGTEVNDGNLPVEEMFSPFAIATTLYVIGLFVLGAVYQFTVVVPIYNPSWQGVVFDAMPYLPSIGVFYPFSYLFFLPPIPVFVAFVYLRRRLKK
jgi:hypothetical protein